MGLTRCATLCAVLAVTAWTGWSRAEIDLSPYLGASVTSSSDVHLQVGGDDLTFRGVAWEGRSFEDPLYYGFRVAYWRERHARWGLALDFTHAKMHAKLDDTVAVSGTRGVQAIDGHERLGDTFDDLSFSHGHNLIVLNAQHRWASDRKRIRPYVGIGLGVAMPHVEIGVAGTSTHEYQRAGFAAQAFAGVDRGLAAHVSLFAEYKLSRADIEVDLDGGGTLEVDPWTHHFVVGTSFTF
jgi:lipid A oxidase